ncbi:hypothetical protein [Desulfoluna spongiiphila]|uniref:Uncharacterized protein n=1 Tax=Desulfoluna spongiiphila TaxID=419481 RepID=A0A1G5FZB7_9BACT|nr:hypothetical protein [Desulfoluna spongiiphila]SCY44544.1 hypothetical protein SAMN05216233_109100 [Desulfoluna spongiiphila]
MDSFNSLLEEYKAKDGIAHLFGVMLYTDEHPNIKKVLRDDDYWLSFNELTGDRFCVFSVRPQKGKYQYPSFPSGTMGMMVPLWREPSENTKLLKVFDLKDTQTLPMLLLFTKVEEEYLKIEVALEDSSIDAAYSSIRKELESSCIAINRIKKENLNNPEGLFAALSFNQDNKKSWQRIKKGLDIFGYIKGLLP